MNINVFRKDIVMFSEIKLGEIFEFENDFYMKMEGRSSEYNAVSIYTGYIYMFSEDEEVTKVKSTLNIEM